MTVFVEEEAEALLRTSPRDHHGDSKPIKQETMKRELTDTEYELSKHVLC